MNIGYLAGEKILVTGGTGMVGRALQKVLPDAAYVGSKYDLTKYDQVVKLFEKEKPKYVIHLAAKVSGMKGNMNAVAEHYTENVLMNTNVLEVSRIYKVEKLLSVLSTCVYPEDTEYPMVEENIHNGEPHSTNLGYGFSKRMLDVQARAYRRQYNCNFVNIIPNNLFGEHDNFHLEESHVIPSVIRKIYEAKRAEIGFVKLWGTGEPLREFTYSGDLAKIIVSMFNDYDEEYPINVGNPGEYSIKEIAFVISQILDYKGMILWDTRESDGQYRKPSDNSKFLNYDWHEESGYTDFKVALEQTCQWFLENYPNVRGVE
jgi:GDP-L-fucose synthase